MIDEFRSFQEAGKEPIKNKNSYTAEKRRSNLKTEEMLGKSEGRESKTRTARDD